jgi:SAM-dependent methyltransferase
MSAPSSPVRASVVWHDVECGGYVEDLPLWRAMAAEHGGPVLDLGAGTGRVALDLARAGHEVVALDVDGELLAALRERAWALPVRTVEADARCFALGRRFPLILAPMQTVQLLDGRESELLSCVAAHLAPGGTFAAGRAGRPARLRRRGAPAARHARARRLAVVEPAGGDPRPARRDGHRARP